MRMAASSCFTLGFVTARPRSSIKAATCSGSIAESSYIRWRSHQSKKSTAARRYARRVCGFRIEPAKNSRKRFAASFPARTITAGNSVKPARDNSRRDGIGTRPESMGSLTDDALRRVRRFVPFRIPFDEVEIKCLEQPDESGDERWPLLAVDGFDRPLVFWVGGDVFHTYFDSG